MEKDFFRIYGGSSKYLDKLLPILWEVSKKNDVKYFIDAFGGGGHVLLNNLGYVNRYGVYIRYTYRLFCDSDIATTDLAELIKNGRYSEVYDWIKNKFNGRLSPEQYRACRDYHRFSYCLPWNEDLDPVARAGMISVAKLASYDGTQIMSTYVRNDEEKISGKLTDLCYSNISQNDLSNVEIRNADSFEILNDERYWGKSYLKFIDPPWIHSIRAVTSEYTTEMAAREEDAEIERKRLTRLIAFCDEKTAAEKAPEVRRIWKEKKRIAECDLKLVHSHQELLELLCNDDMHSVVMIGYDFPEKADLLRRLNEVMLDHDMRIERYEEDLELTQDKRREKALKATVKQQNTIFEKKRAALEEMLEHGPFYAELERHGYVKKRLVQQENVKGEDNSVYIWYKL